MSGSMKRRALAVMVSVLFLATLVLVVAGITRDEAEREYMAFLRSDEDGSTMAQRQAHIHRAIELAPDRARYYETRGVSRIDGSDSPGALRDIERAIALDDRPYLRYLRALILSESGEYSLALVDYDHAIAAQPNNTQFYRGRALARIAVGRSSDALADGNRMVSDVPQWGLSYFARGSALASLGRDRAALADFDEAVRRSPDLVYVHSARADCRERLGDLAGARAGRAEAEQLAEGAHRFQLEPFRY